MKLLEFSYRNILSYGNVLQTFKFDDTPKLILVEGENGAGKSSIKEALTISMYGRSAIRKMKDIPNWINRNAFTHVKFETSSGEEVEVSRGIDPNFSNILINAATFNLPDKRKVDEFIEDELVKIPFSVFCNTISLSFDDFKSFVNLSKDDKRKIIDRIFGIDVLSEMRSIVREDLKSVRKEIDLLDKGISQSNQTLANSIAQLDLLKDRLSKKRDQQTVELTQTISDKESAKESIKSEYTDLKKKADLIKESLAKVVEEKNRTSFTISDLANKLKIYEKNRCPHCLNDLTSESSTKTKEVIKSKKKMLEDALPAIVEMISDLTIEFENYSTDQQRSRDIYVSITNEIDLLKIQLEQATAELESDETDSIQTIIETIKKDLVDSQSQHSDKQQEAGLYSILDDLLSDSGIKSTLIDKIIPTLNTRIFQISEKLDFKFSFEFDNDFNPVITYLGMQISAESLSSGQRKKMNLIVLLAFIEIIKMKHSQMNVMFLDEIFSSLDKNNVYLAIEILREYAVKYNMTIFVVSHEALPEEFFDQKIFVKSVNHFSEMQITDIGKEA